MMIASRGGLTSRATSVAAKPSIARLPGRLLTVKARKAETYATPQLASFSKRMGKSSRRHIGSMSSGECLARGRVSMGLRAERREFSA
eukprot:1155566-Pelagomonas_calceolata.AAC.8